MRLTNGVMSSITIPAMRPYQNIRRNSAGSERLREAELAALVTRDAMVGTARVALPREGAAA